MTRRTSWCCLLCWIMSLCSWIYLKDVSREITVPSDPSSKTLPCWTSLTCYACPRRRKTFPRIQLPETYAIQIKMWNSVTFLGDKWDNFATCLQSLKQQYLTFLKNATDSSKKTPNKYFYSIADIWSYGTQTCFSAQCFIDYFFFIAMMTKWERVTQTVM